MRLPSATLALAAALLVGPACSKVDETGYFHEERIHYSGVGALDGSSDNPVLVVGEAGAVEVAGGTLLVEDERSGVAVPGVVDADTRSLAAAIAGRMGDSLHLTYTVDGDDGELTLALDEPLAGVVAPDCTSCGVGWSLVGAPAGGVVEVDLSVLDDPTPPFVVASVDRGVVVVADAVDEPVEIPADSGGQVCAYQIVDGAPGPARCAVVP